MRWRLARAAQMLRRGQEAVIRIAERSGYEFRKDAFSHAF
jgi:AraC-like DNA-binding protein